MKRFNQLINAFGNMPAIYEGIKNRVFVREDVEQIAAIRWSICQRVVKLVFFPFLKFRDHLLMPRPFRFLTASDRMAA